MNIEEQIDLHGLEDNHCLYYVTNQSQKSPSTLGAKKYSTCPAPSEKSNVNFSGKFSPNLRLTFSILWKILAEPYFRLPLPSPCSASLKDFLLGNPLQPAPEKEFKQIKPKIFSGRRRYYDKETIKILKKIRFLLKEKGLTISGVKKFLIDESSFNLDETTNTSITSSKNNLKSKLKKISSLVKEIKKLGQYG